MALVKLYVFAEENDVAALKSAVVSELRTGFACRERYLDMEYNDDYWRPSPVELLRCLYRKTSRPSEDCEESLRTFLIGETFSEMLVAAQSEEFRTLCIESGALVADILVQFKKEADVKALLPRALKPPSPESDSR